MSNPIRNARTLPDILAAIARATWANAHAGEECPANMIPSVAKLGEFVFAVTQHEYMSTSEPNEEYIRKAVREANRRLSAVFDRHRAGWTAFNALIPDSPAGPTMRPMLFAVVIESAEENPREGIWGTAAQLEARGIEVPRAPSEKGYNLEEVHHRWLALPDDRQPQHPLAPLVRAWQERPREAAPYNPKRRASLPSFQKVATDNVLPGFPGADTPAQPDQLALPGFEPAITVCPSWLLWLYDEGGGESMTQGRGAPWDMHLFVSAFLHLAIEDRHGRWVTLRFPHLAEHEADWPIPGTPSIERWFFAEGWDRGNKRRDWHRLPEALHRMKRNLGYVPVNGGRIATIFPSAIPDTKDFPVVEFTVRVPQSAAHGARVDWDRLRIYRLHSAALYRAYLSAVAYMDRSSHHGNPITREIGTPVLGPDGQPKRRKGGRIVRSARDTIVNPLAGKVGALDDRDLTRMIGLNADDKRRRADARKAFERLHADGVIELVRDGKSFCLFGTGKIQ